MAPFVYDEITRRNIEECERLRKEFKEEKQREVEALGYSSWGELTELSMKRFHENQLIYEEHMNEKCALMGKTREEMDAEDPQRWIESDWPECNCEGHFIPCFCPQRLIPYKSMGEPDQSGLLKYRSATRIEELKMNENDVSKRFSDEDLEMLWVTNSQERPLRLPVWTKNDEVLHRIMDAERLSSTAHSCSYSAESPMRAMIDTRGTLQSQTASEFTMITNSRTDETSTSNETLPESLTSPEDQATVQKQATTRSQKNPRNALTRNHDSAHRRSQAKKVNRTAPMKASGIKKRTPCSTTQAPKSVAHHPMRTRSQGVTTFYVLNSNGRSGTTSWRKSKEVDTRLQLRRGMQ